MIGRLPDVLSWPHPPFYPRSEQLEDLVAKTQELRSSDPWQNEVDLNKKKKFINFNRLQKIKEKRLSYDLKYFICILQVYVSSPNACSLNARIPTTSIFRMCLSQMVDTDEYAPEGCIPVPCRDN